LGVDIDVRRSHREALLDGGFSENITLLQRRPVDDLAKTLAMAYSLREERVTSSLTEENDASEPQILSGSITGRFQFGKDELEVRRTGGVSSLQSVPPQSNGATRWGRGFFKNNSSNPQVNTAPKTPPPPEPKSEDPPSKFSPGAWGASLSAASRNFNKLRFTPGSPDTSPSQSKSAVHLDDRPTTVPPFSTIKESTSTISARVSAAVRDSFDRRNEIIQKVGGWVANESSGRSSLTDWEEVQSPISPDGSRASEEIKRLEGEIRKKEKEISPEEYIARIKKRREERESREIKKMKGGSGSNVDDPLGVGGM
jgi:hypothetical protein